MPIIQVNMCKKCALEQQKQEKSMFYKYVKYMMRIFNINIRVTPMTEKQDLHEDSRRFHSSKNGREESSRMDSVKIRRPLLNSVKISHRIHKPRVHREPTQNPVFARNVPVAEEHPEKMAIPCRSGAMSKPPSQELVFVVPQRIRKKVSYFDDPFYGYSQKKLDDHVQQKKIEYMIRSIHDEDAYIEKMTRAIMRAKLEIDDCTFKEIQDQKMLAIFPR